MFICIEGIDGAGKTSAARILVEDLRSQGWPVYLAEHNRYRASTPSADSHLLSLRSLQAAAVESSSYAEFSELHWTLLKAAYYALIDQHVITPALQAGQIVVADGWFYKFAARIASNGITSMSQILPYYNEVRHPDLVFLLDVEPGVAASRLGNFNSGELGPTNVRAIHPAMAFTEYQSAVRANLHRFATSKGWLIVSGSHRSAAQTAKRIRDDLGRLVQATTL
jgi:dTMP kinase